MKLKQPVTINVVAEIVVRNVDTGEEVRYTTSNSSRIHVYHTDSDQWYCV